MWQIQNPGFSLNFYFQVITCIFTHVTALFDPVNKIILSPLKSIFKDNIFHFHF